MKATALSRVSRHADQFIVRLPDGMRDRIAEAAKANGRSMNAEIVHRLEQSFAPDVAQGVEDLRSMMTEIKERMTMLLAAPELAKAPLPKRRRQS